MVRKIPFRFAVNIMLVLLSLVIVYHLLIITGAIPYEATWGGRLETTEQMYRFESVSILVNLAMIAVVAIKGRLVKRIKAGKVITVLLWLMFASFLLNTIGNITSMNQLEAIIFTPLTLVSAILCWRMAIE